MKRRRIQTAIVADARRGLEFVVGTLNSPQGSELRQIVKLWQASGPSTLELFVENPTLSRELQAAWRPLLLPTKSGNANINFVGGWGAKEMVAGLGEAGLRHQAVVLFNALIVNPLWGKLAGPCPRCQNYYIKKRESQKVYCSRRCGNAATAEARTREVLEKDRLTKLRMSVEEIQNWTISRTKEDWKPWVAKRVTKRMLKELLRAGTRKLPAEKRASITSKFLTRAVGKGKIIPPTKGSGWRPAAR